MQRAKVTREQLEKEKIETFRSKMSNAYDMFMSSFKYSIPVGLSQMAILQSIAIFPVIHFGIFAYRLNRNAQSTPSVEPSS